MRFSAAALFVLVLAAPRGAAAYDSGDGAGSGINTATSIGPRAAFYHPLDADRGEWGPGVQLRLHMTPMYSLEGSADFVDYSSHGTKVHAIPVQATVIGFFYPDSSFSPYLLLGGGWYLTRADGPYQPQRIFGPHVGAGLQLLLGNNWSIDGSYRYLWTEVIDWTRPLHVVGHDFNERGSLVTVGLNYRL